MSFTTGIYNSSWNHLLYVCKVRVHPNGRLLQYSYPQGHTSYWFHRLKVEIKFVSCEDFLVLGLIPEDITQPNLQPEVWNLTCRSKFPLIVDSKHRIISLVWHTSTGSTDSVSSELDVQMSAYMRFEGSFTTQDKMQRCETGSGFWCGNQTAVCIYGQMRCDQADGCFDGGTDEIGCPPPRNYTDYVPRRRRGSWSSYLPWAALGFIPIILICVLGLICTPKKPLDEFGDEDVDGLKSASPCSAVSSSSTRSSGSQSPESTHSAILFSSIDRSSMTQSLTRSASQPYITCSEYSKIGPRSGGRASATRYPDAEMTTPSPCELSSLNHKSVRAQDTCPSGAFEGSVRNSLVNRTKGVTFRLPKSSRHSDVTHRAKRTIDRPLSTKSNGSVSQISLSSLSADPLSSSTSSSRINGVDNKLFALPAHFELAALRVGGLDEPIDRNINLSSVGPEKRVRSPGKGFGRVSNGRTTVRHSGEVNATKVISSQPASFDSLYSSSRGVDNSGLTLSTLTSSSTGSSDREDVTPFRRPDPLSSATLASPLSNGQPINLSKHSANDNLLDDTRSQLIHGSSKPNKTHPDDGTGLALKPVPRHRTKRTYVRKNIRSSEYVLL